VSPEDNIGVEKIPRIKKYGLCSGKVKGQKSEFEYVYHKIKQK